MNVNLSLCWFVAKPKNWNNTSVGGSGFSPLSVPTLKTVSNNVDRETGTREMAALRNRHVL